MTKRKFSTGTLERELFTLSALDLAPLPADGNIVRGLKIFRVGTFKDSKGHAKTWTRQQLSEMVRLFAYLRSTNILPNVPLRIDHTETMKDVIGYFSNVYVDPTNPDLLLADVEFTEPDHLEKYKRGTYRSRSIEIGTYEDNDGNKYSPVVMGLAFVDLPALEHLYRLQDPSSGTGDPSPAPVAGNQPKETIVSKFRINGKDVEDATEIQRQIDALEAFRASAEPIMNHKFKVNGVETNDFAAVQAHCLALETFRSEAVTSGRHAYVDTLAKDGKIGNPMVESFKKLVDTMTSDQWDEFKKGYDAAPQMAIFSKSGSTTTTGAPIGTGDGITEIETLEGIVQMHLDAGKSKAEVEQMSSYKQLQALKAKS